MKEFGLTKEILENLDTDEKIEKQRKIISKTYHQLALIYHPDRPGKNEVRFKEIVVNLGIVNAILDDHKVTCRTKNPKKARELHQKQVSQLCQAIEWKQIETTMTISNNSPLIDDVQPQENPEAKE